MYAVLNSENQKLLISHLPYWHADLMLLYFFFPFVLFLGAFGFSRGKNFSLKITIRLNFYFYLLLRYCFSVFGHLAVRKSFGPFLSSDMNGI